MRLNIVSEAAWAKGQGVHTAFIENCAALDNQKIPYTINHLGPADIHHAQTIGPLFWLLTAFRRRVIVTAHVVPDSLIDSLIFAKYWKPIARWYLRTSYNHADLVIAVSPAVKAQLTELGVRKPILFVPNPVNRKRFFPNHQLRQAFRTKLGIQPDQKVFICTGQVQTRKGVTTFLRLATEFPQHRFVWVGGYSFGHLTDGRNEIDHALKHAPPNFTLTGIVPYEDMNGYYNAADIFLFPSLQENFPFSVVEAAACGLPLILRDLDFYNDIYTGAYLKATEETFVEAINLLTTNVTLTNEYRAKALKLAERYDINQMGLKLKSIYEQMRQDLPFSDLST